MVFREFEEYLVTLSYRTEMITTTQGQDFLIIREFELGKARSFGSKCDIGILRTNESPWVPHTAIHVRPHLVIMGQFASQPSPIGADWQYLSRRFNHTPTPKQFLAHIYTVLNEL